MNAIYKVIWNDAIRQYQVVNELCRSRRKTCSVKAVHTDGGHTLRKLAIAVGASLVALGSMGNAWAVTNEDGVLVFNESLVLNGGGATLNGGTAVELTDELLKGATGINFTNVSIQGTIDAVVWDNERKYFNADVILPEDFQQKDFTFTINGKSEYVYSVNQDYDYYFTLGTGLLSNSPVPALYGYMHLTRIDSHDGKLYYVNTIDGESTNKDLTAKLTGQGGFQYVVDQGASGGASDDETIRFAGEGAVLVNNEQNAYSGITNIGYVANPEVQDNVIVTAGSDNIFGSEANGAYTSLLNIKTNSGLEMKGTEQWTHALAGGGTSILKI